jgi:hypothetical protein
VLEKCLTRADIVREAMLLQQLIQTIWVRNHSKGTSSSRKPIDMAAAGQAVFDFGTEGTLERRFNALSATMVVPQDYFPGLGSAAIRFEAGRVFTSVPWLTDKLKTVPLSASPPALVVP